MTAIMVAGRSGSAFAAQLGTMKITEEIDAMRTIGVSPIEALVVPRMLAAVVMMPLLAFYAMVMSMIGGGMFCWIALGIPPLTYIQRMQEVVPITDLWVGLIKAPVFGVHHRAGRLLPGHAGRRQFAKRSGIRTTDAVVQAIFLVIVLDAVFAVFFQLGRLEMSDATDADSSSRPRAQEQLRRPGRPRRTSTSTSGAARSSASSAGRAPASRC